MASWLWGVVVLMLAVGCGGSSSETPPPLEPDPDLLAGRVKPAEAQPAGTGSEVPLAQPGPIPPLRGSNAPSAAPVRHTPTWGAESENELAPAPWREPPAKAAPKKPAPPAAATAPRAPPAAPTAPVRPPASP